MAAAIAAGGCGGDDVVTLGDHLREVEYNVPLEGVASVSLGAYRIPIAARCEATDEEGGYTTWMRLQFELFAETPPEYRKSVEQVVERHADDIKSAVLVVCRSTSVEELNDARLASVRARLGDVIRSLVGAHRVRGVLLTGVRTEML